MLFAITFFFTKRPWSTPIYATWRRAPPKGGSRGRCSASPEFFKCFSGDRGSGHAFDTETNYLSTFLSPDSEPQRQNTLAVLFSAPTDDYLKNNIDCPIFRPLTNFLSSGHFFTFFAKLHKFNECENI